MNPDTSPLCEISRRPFDVPTLTPRPYPVPTPLLSSVLVCWAAYDAGLSIDLVDHGDVPPGEIARRHRQLAGGEEPAAPLLGRLAQWSERVAQVALRIGGAECRVVGDQYRLQVERREDLPPKKGDHRHAGHLLDDHPGDDIVGVAVLPPGTGLEVERLARPRVGDLAGRRGMQHWRHDVILRPVVLVSRRHREHLPHGHFVGARQFRQPAAHLVIQGQLAALGQQEDRGGRELLADRSDAVAHGRGCRQARLESRRSVGIGVHDFRAAHHGDRGAGRSRARQHVARGAVDAGLHVRGERLLGVDRRGDDRDREEHDTGVEHANVRNAH